MERPGIPESWYSISMFEPRSRFHAEPKAMKGIFCELSRTSYSLFHQETIFTYDLRQGFFPPEKLFSIH
jgi:hypothetical protein